MDKSFIISSIKFRDTNKDIEVFQNTMLNTELLFIPSKEKTIDEYEIYGKIEQHMELSIDLHYLQKQTQCIVASLAKYKPSVVKSCNVYSVLRDIAHVVNFASLINVLDEVLFNDCGHFKTFWVQDKEYNLEALYYKQESWTDDLFGIGKDVQSFEFDDEPTINLDEGMYLLMICDKWLKCLSKAFNISDNKNLYQVVGRFEKRVEHCLDYIFLQLESNDNGEEEAHFVKELKSSRRPIEKKLKVTKQTCHS
jgi:hypothetical protein